MDFLANLQSGFMDIVFPNLDKHSQNAIKDQVDPKDLSGGGVKIRAAIVEHTLGKGKQFFFPCPWKCPPPPPNPNLLSIVGTITHILPLFVLLPLLSVALFQKICIVVCFSFSSVSVLKQLSALPSLGYWFPGDMKKSNKLNFLKFLIYFVFV